MCSPHRGYEFDSKNTKLASAIVSSDEAWTAFLLWQPMSHLQDSPTLPFLYGMELTLATCRSRINSVNHSFTLLFSKSVQLRHSKADDGTGFGGLKSQEISFFSTWNSPQMTRPGIILHFQICSLAGAPGFEPGNADTKNRCLTTWRRPNESGGIANSIVAGNTCFAEKWFHGHLSTALCLWCRI